MACEIGFLADAVPDFPLPLGELGPLRAAAEQKGSRDFTPLWSGQAAALSREMPAAMLMQITDGEVEDVAHLLHVVEDQRPSLPGPIGAPAAAWRRLR